MFTSSMTFDLGEDVAAMRNAVHSWAQERVKPLAARIDQDNLFPAHLWPEMGALAMSEAGAGSDVVPMSLRAERRGGIHADAPLARLFRYAKLMEIGAGTSEIRRMLIGRELMGAMG